MENLKEKSVNIINQILKVLIEIVESHNLNQNNNLEINMIGKNNENSEILSEIISKHFNNELLENKKNNIYIVHKFETFKDFNKYYETLYDDFLKNLYYIKNNIKSLLLYEKSINKQYIFDSIEKFICYYNLLLFMKELVEKYPDIIKEDIFKIDFMFILLPYYKDIYQETDFEFEPYTSYIYELICLINEKYNANNDFTKFEYKFSEVRIFFNYIIELD